MHAISQYDTLTFGMSLVVAIYQYMYNEYILGGQFTLTGSNNSSPIYRRLKNTTYETENTIYSYSIMDAGALGGGIG